MLNYETLLSSYDDRLTLMQWLKKVEGALKDASAVSFNVNDRGDANYTFSVVFEDGSQIESNPISLPQFENAYIQNGHLHIVLSSGEDIDAGELFNGDVNINGNVNVNGNFTANSIIENMEGYSFAATGDEAVTMIYVGVVKNGNKITFVMYGSIRLQAPAAQLSFGKFYIPSEIGSKLYGGFTSATYLDSRPLYLATRYDTGVSKPVLIFKNSNTTLDVNLYNTSDLSLNTDYFFRYEVTFLLSENLAA